MKRRIKVRLRIVLGAAALLLVALLTVVAYDPFWLVERATDAYLWKNGIHHREIMVNGHRIHYLEAAPEGGGAEKPIVLVHGLGARASDWAMLTPALAQHGYHVYALDLLGYGTSDKPMDGDFSLDNEERTVAGFIDALHLREPDVAGWSMGGWIAAKYALDHPQRVRRLVLYDSAGMYMPLDFSPAIFSPHDEQTLRALIYRIEPDRPIIRLPSVAVPGLIRRLTKSERILNSSLSSMLDGHAILDFRIHQLRMPVLLVWGDQDKLTPAVYGSRMHELVPQSVYLQLQGCGHLAIVECSSQGIPPTIRFLDADPPLPASDQTIPAKSRPPSQIALESRDQGGSQKVQPSGGRASDRSTVGGAP